MFTATIAESKEELIKEEAKDNSDIKIYTDGSGFEGSVGAAAVLYRKGVEELEKILRFHLGSLKKHTMFKGEAVGSILRARKSRPGQYLVTEYLSLTEAVHNSTNVPCPIGTAKFALKWVAVHEGVTANERVNEEVKRAAQGESSLLEDLPPILRKRLPYSASAVKQEFAEMQKVRWKEPWRDSPHYARFQHIDTDFPFNKFQRISDKLSRSQASLLMQLRTGHLPLNSYLYHIKKLATSCCESCWGIARLTIKETVIHYLFKCQVYAAECYDMDRALGHQSQDLQGILGSLDGIKELLKFIGRMARFKKMLGDALGDVSHLDTYVSHLVPYLME